MGFFKDLKEDLSLAVSEITGEDINDNENENDDDDVFAAAEESLGLEYKDEEEEAADDEEPEIEGSLSSFLDKIAANAEKSETKYKEADEDSKEEEVEPETKAPELKIPEVKAPVTEELNFAAKAAMAKAMVTASYEEKKREETTYRETVRQVHEEAARQAAEEAMPKVTDELGVVTANMTVKGDMSSTGSLDVMGAVYGNIKVLGELNISGVVNGNCEAGNIVATNCDVIGDLISSGPIKVGSNAIVRGNIIATSAVISGAVKGDIDVHGPVILDSTAIIMGNIKSKAVQINNGAAIEGMCSQCYAEVSPAAFFRD